MSKQIKQANILLNEIVANKFLFFFFSGFLFPVSLGTKQTKKRGRSCVYSGRYLYNEGIESDGYQSHREKK